MKPSSTKELLLFFYCLQRLSLIVKVNIEKKRKKDPSRISLKPLEYHD